MPIQDIDLGATSTMTYDGANVKKLYLNEDLIWPQNNTPTPGSSVVPSNASGTFIGGVAGNHNLVKTNEISLMGIARFDVQSRITIEFFSWFMDDLGRAANFDDYSTKYVKGQKVTRVFNKAKNSNTWVGVVQGWNTDAGGILPGPWSYQIDDDDFTDPGRGDGKWGGISDLATYYGGQTDSINHTMITSGHSAYNALAGKSVGSTAYQTVAGANEVHLFYGGWSDDDNTADAPYGVSFLKESNDKLSIWAGALDFPDFVSGGAWVGHGSNYGQGIYNEGPYAQTSKIGNPKTEWLNSGYLRYSIQGVSVAQMKFPLKDWKVTAEIIAV